MHIVLVTNQLPDITKAVIAVYNRKGGNYARN